MKKELLETKNEVKISKRFLAYLLDIILVYFIISLITSIRFINPYYEKYMETYNSYSDITEKYINNEIDAKEFISVNKENYYYLSKYSVTYNIVIIVVIIGYFVLFQKYNNGQTIGKKIMKIKVTNLDGKNTNIMSYFLRSLLMYYVYIGSMIPLIINSILVYILTPSNFMEITLAINFIFVTIGIVILVSMNVRKDKRGIHDLIANTKVVYEES